VTAAINLQFRLGGEATGADGSLDPLHASTADDALARSGVFVTQVDATHDALRPWLPCLQAEGPCFADVGDNGTRFSGSVLSRRLPGIWGGGQPGFVLQPSSISIRCAYSRDGYTFGRGFGKKAGNGSSHMRTAACPPGEGRCWCESLGQQLCPASHRTPCAWRHAEIGQMQQQQAALQSTYNELVFEWADVVDRLPQSIMAIFVAANGDLPAARALHASFLEAFEPLTTAEGTPLLVYDPRRNATDPFWPPSE